MISRFLWGDTSTRSAEDPRVPLSEADEDLYAAFGAGPSLTGIPINRRTALTYAAVNRACSMISADVAQLPIVVYR